MAAEVQPLQPVLLTKTPDSITAEQRHWNSFTSKLDLDPSSHSSPVTHISYPPPPPSHLTVQSHDLFAVTSGSRIQIFSSKTRKPLKTISRFGVDDIAHSGTIRRDGRIVLAGGETGAIQAFDLNSRAILKTWKEHKQPVWRTEWSPHNLTELMSCSDDRSVRLWDLPSDKSVTTFNGHQDYVRSGCFMPAQSGLLVSGSYDQTVRLWDPRVGDKSVMIFKHAAAIESILPMPSGTALLASSGNTVSVLDLVAAKPIQLLKNHQKTVTSLALAQGGERVLTGALDGHVKVFETAGWNMVAGLKFPSPILSLAVIPGSSKGLDKDDRHIAVGLQSGILSLRTRLTGAQKSAAKEREKEMKALMEGTIEEYDRAKSKKRKRGKGWEKRVRGKDFTGEGADIVIEGNARGREQLGKKWQQALRWGKYSEALDLVLASTDGDAPTQTLTLLTSLLHRSALRAALSNRSASALPPYTPNPTNMGASYPKHYAPGSIQPILRWCISHISDFRTTRLVVDVSLMLLDIYGGDLGKSEEVDMLVENLHRRVKVVVDASQMSLGVLGMLGMLEESGRAATEVA